MGFLTTQDRIGNVSYSSGIITLQPSLLTIGGQQYRTPTLNVSLSGLTANTLYMVYVVMTGPTSFQLVVSGNYNSVGPAGYTKWKLVGAFYADGALSLGSFIDNLYDRPTTVDRMSYSVSWTGSTNPAIVNGTLLSTWGRDGETLALEIAMVAGSSTTFGSGQWNFTGPSAFTFNTSKITGYGTSSATVGTAYMNDNTVAFYIGLTVVINTNQVRIHVNGGAAVGATTPFTWGNTDNLTLNAKIPVLGWSNTPIAYL